MKGKLSVALVLGGDSQREDFALTDWHRQNPNMPIYLSGGSTTEQISNRFQKRGEILPPFFNDLRARNTVGNFTSMIPAFKRAGVKHVFVLTSSSHLRRALTIGRIVLGSRGISCEGVIAHYDPERRETNDLMVEGIALATLWVSLGPLADRVLGVGKLYKH